MSSIPHKTLNLRDEPSAIGILRAALVDRVRETDTLRDARIQLAAQNLTQDELTVLKELSRLAPGEACDIANPTPGFLSVPIARGVDGLLAKGFIKSGGVNTSKESVFYAVTPFGYSLAKAVGKLLVQIDPEELEKHLAKRAAGQDADSANVE